MRSWVAALRTPAYAQLPPDTAQLILWVTAGSWQRAHTIRQIWADYTRQLAVFTTCAQLRGERDEGAMRPLEAIWSDPAGGGVLGDDLFVLALNASRS